MDISLGGLSTAPKTPVTLPLKMANRHGLIAGATGTGKTVTLKIIAEQFAAAGIPVFLTDIKGDLTGFCQPSALQDFLVKRADLLGQPIMPTALPMAVWDIFGDDGIAVRTTPSEMGPLLLGRLMELNETQQGVLDILFKMADDEGLLILDLSDLRALLSHMSDNTQTLSKTYGNVTAASVAAIQRALLRLQEQGADMFFGEPALDLNDLMQVTYDGRGMVNVLKADRLMTAPRLYASFLLWLLSELFEQLPEAGDTAKPKFVLFFDEAHLLFTDTPKIVLEKIAQVVRLIRSKGVGVYFITQGPGDIPDTILAQLGHRVQHALRAFTPAQQKDIKACADGFRPNPAFDVRDAVQSLQVGEALVSVLQSDGTPSVVEKVMIRPPVSTLGPADTGTLKDTNARNPLMGKYHQRLDRVSATETLGQRNAQRAAETPAPEEAEKPRATNGRMGSGEALMKSVIRAVGSQVGRQLTNALIRGVLGGLRGGQSR
ncbi:MAG: helicase HerA-like domain-containing protein [Pseudomonadota bacterium]